MHLKGGEKFSKMVRVTKLIGHAFPFFAHRRYPKLNSFTRTSRGQGMEGIPAGRICVGDNCLIASEYQHF